MNPSCADRDWLWDATDSFDARYEKIAATLIAVHDTLRDQRPLAGGEREFLDLYAQLAASDAECFTRVWHDPYAYFWSRMAYEILGALLSGRGHSSHVKPYADALGCADHKALLRTHLAHCQRLMLGVAHAAEKAYSLTSPLPVSLPFAIPASPLSLCGEGEVVLLGLCADGLRFDHGGKTYTLALEAGAATTDQQLRIEACPMVLEADCEIRLQAHAFHNIPGLDFTAPVLEYSPVLYAEKRPLIAAAVNIMAQYAPHSLAQFRELISVIGLKDYASGDYTNISFSDLSGAIVVSVIDNPYDLADTLIHELHHQRLFFLEEDGPFLLDPFLPDVTHDPELAPKHYSPWRVDPRPLQGLMHAVYVHVPVCHYWLALAQDGAVDCLTRDYARSRAARVVWQMRIGIAQLRDHARFTANGQRLFGQLERDAADLWQKAHEQLGDVDSVPAYLCLASGEIVAQRHKTTNEALTVLAAIRAHVETHARTPERELILATWARTPA